IDLQFKEDGGVRSKFGGEHPPPRLAHKPVVADWLGPAGLVAMKCRRRLPECRSVACCAGFSDAGMTRPTTRWCGRRPRSAKARSRGRVGSGDAASYGIWPRRVIRKSACK